ncbi:hypothetical protein ASE63_15620 [Bosea sp. Root381]|nr:hypothetical protein ASE63_15620 [Bosea sp. Root381]
MPVCSAEPPQQIISVGFAGHVHPEQQIVLEVCSVADCGPASFEIAQSDGPALSSRPAEADIQFDQALEPVVDFDVSNGTQYCPPIGVQS